ncbi:YajG family lipoprotein [Aliidiomarina taiwanensis]|nr:YajG family lipoprotein [Aliidiomarina taiwanensis]
MMYKHTPCNPFSLRPALLAACASMVLLSGCKSTEFGPLQADLSTTQLANQASTQQPRLPAQLNVVDMRPQHHVLRLHYKTEPAQFATFQQPLTMIIQQQLAPYLADPTNNPLRLQLNIQEGLCVADQTLSRHAMNCRFSVQVTANQSRGTWTKTYTATRNREGKLKLKPDYVESDMVAIMDTALSHFMNDQDFKDWLTRP